MFAQVSRRKGRGSSSTTIISQRDVIPVKTPTCLAPTHTIKKWYRLPAIHLFQICLPIHSCICPINPLPSWFLPSCPDALQNMCALFKKKRGFQNALKGRNKKSKIVLAVTNDREYICRKCKRHLRVWSRGVHVAKWASLTSFRA